MDEMTLLGIKAAVAAGVAALTAVWGWFGWLVVAVLLTIPVERCGEQLHWGVPLWLQALACAALVTAAELAAGLILNVWLGLGVWDYSDLPGNFMGQICPQFAAIWFGLCLVFIPAFDWMRWSVEGGQRPKYYL